MDSIHDQKCGSPESLETRAFAGFYQVVKLGRNTVLTTGMTTDRKIFDFRLGRGIIAKTEYPGVAELVPRHIWDVEIARSNRVTRTNAPRSIAPGGVSLFIAAQGLRGCPNIELDIFGQNAYN